MENTAFKEQRFRINWKLLYKIIIHHFFPIELISSSREVVAHPMGLYFVIFLTQLKKIRE